MSLSRNKNAGSTFNSRNSSPKRREEPTVVNNEESNA